jgi:predicted RNA-binding Zn-ribbon protein involved in translation (DUF1610 family)
VRGMPTWSTGKAQFTCPQCGTQYQCTYKDYPSGDPRQTYDCPQCGATVHTWKGTRDYFDWEPVEPNK